MGEGRVGEDHRDDLLGVPEFLMELKDPYIRGVPEYPRPDRNPQKQSEKLQEYRVTLQKKMRDGDGQPARWLSSILLAMTGKLQIDYSFWRERAMADGAIAAASAAVARAKTNLVPTQVGNSTILWNLRIQIESGGTLEVELSNDNAANIDSTR